jgi:hypothetical protein
MVVPVSGFESIGKSIDTSPRYLPKLVIDTLWGIDVVVVLLVLVASTDGMIMHAPWLVLYYDFMFWRPSMRECLSV